MLRLRAVRTLLTADECNSSNHWVVRPEDYDAVSAATDARHWLPLWHADRVLYVEHFSQSELAWLRRARTTAQLSAANKLSPLFVDEMEALEAAHADFNTRLATGEWFVRAENVSFKYGVHGGHTPLRSLRAIVESMITAEEGHQPLSDVAPGVPRRELTMYAVPWDSRMSPRAEWRVFVHNNRVTAMSQQVWYKDVGISAAAATRAAGLIVAFWNDAVLPKLTGAIAPSVVVDMAVFEDDDTCMFIEVNPFGAEYSSGSALFHWVHDADVLYGDGSSVTVAFVETG